MTNDSEDVHLRSREKTSNGSGSASLSTNGDNFKNKAKLDKMKRIPGASRPRSKKVILFGIFVLVLLAWALFFSGPSVPNHSVGWWDENVYLRFGLSKEAYAVVLDAGSTGTRVLAFAFHQSVNGKLRWV